MRLPELNIVEQGVWSPPYVPEKTPLRFVLYYELEIHHESDVKSIINGESIDCFDGLVTLAKPGDIRYSSRPKERIFRRDFVRFEVVGDPHGVCARLLKNIPSFFVLDDRLEVLWQEFSDCYNSVGDEIKRTEAYMKLFLILVYLSEKGGDDVRRTKPPSPHQQALFEAIRLMRDRMDQPLSIGDIAGAIGYSPSHFNHLFKQYTKTTPYAYYTSLRMAEARRLLSLSEMTVSQISDALAFGNVSKFSYAFRSYYRMTPGQFRAAYRQSLVKE